MKIQRLKCQDKIVKKLLIFLCALTLVFGFVVKANATLTLQYSDFSSDETPASELTALVEFDVSGSELLIDIDNTSDFLIAQLYFNSDDTLKGLSFAGTFNSAWSISGTGTSQALGADGFGNYNWLIDFDSGTNRLSSGLTQLTINMTGTTTEETIGSKLSGIPPGNTQAIAAMKFEAKSTTPIGDSAFGATVTIVPEPATMLLFGSGLIGMAGLGRKKFFKKA